MNKAEELLARLEEIGKSLSQRKNALALIGLGSVGIERERLDAYSDLDFFAIVKNGSKDQFLADISWLSEIAPVAFFFANTPDGYKLLYEDGVFCEFAVFDETELETAIFSPGKAIWKADGVSDQISIPQRRREQKEKPSTAWLLGECLTNLYIGLQRDQRGEKLSAMRFIQSYAVDRLLELAESVETPTPTARDEFNLERRYEERFPSMSKLLPTFLQGYEKNRESAQAIVAYLDENFEINSAMKAAILTHCES